MLVTCVNHENRIRQTFHVFDTAQRAFQFFHFASHIQQFFFVIAAGFRISQNSCFFFQAFDRLLNRFIVCQHAAQPTMVNIRHACTLRLFFNDIACLTFGTNKQNSTFVRHQTANNFLRLLEQWNSFFQVNNVNFITHTKNVLSHFGVPVTSLVTEMHTGFNHLAHSNLRHIFFL